MLNHVSGDYDIEAGPHRCRDAVLKIAQHEFVHTVSNSVDLETVDPGDVMAEFAQAFGEPSTRASKVEDSLRGRAAQHLEQDGVRRALAFLEVVLVARRNPAVCAESHPVQAVD